MQIGFADDSTCVCFRVLGSDCGMKIKSCAAWADLLRSGCALQAVAFGGGLVADRSLDVVSEVTRVGSRVACADHSLGDDEVVMLTDAAATHSLLTALIVKSTCRGAGWRDAVFLRLLAFMLPRVRAQ